MNKMKKYYRLSITTHKGEAYVTGLKLSEFHILKQVIAENKSVKVEIDETTEEKYKLTFNA